MAAPNAGLLTALRSFNRPARHLFFKLAHSQGDVLAWDGLGTRTFNGQTYTGIGNMASVSGISYSQDLQTYNVTVTLNGVPYTAITDIDPDIRNDAATIYAAWYSENGEMITSKLLFSGLGNFITIPFGERTYSIVATLRGKMADWAKAPQSYYTNREQQRLYPGDTGFTYMQTLENSTVSGWGAYAESTGGTIKIATQFIQSMFDSLQLKALGSDLSGPFVNRVSGTDLRYLGTGNALKSVTGLLTVDSTASPSPLDVSCGGPAVYLSIDGYCYNSIGQRICPLGTDTANAVRAAADISSIGTATATTFSLATGAGYTDAIVTTGTGALASGSNPDRFKNMPFTNTRAYVLYHNGGIVRANGVAMVEETSGTAVVITGGLMKCNGQNVVLSSTGVLLTNLGRRIIPTGGSASVDFARMWS